MLQSEQDSSVLFFVVPSGKIFSPYNGQYLLSLMIQEPQAIIKFLDKKLFLEEIEAILIATDHPQTAIYCPFCRRRLVERFILPDLDLCSPCFRQTCCGDDRCQEKLVETYNVGREKLRTFSLRTVIDLKDSYHQRAVCKYIREVIRFPKTLGGVELINWCQEIFDFQAVAV